jgi:uncharacterized protein YgiM (DUF1202 family)
MSQSEATIRHLVSFGSPSQAEPEKPKKPEPGPEGPRPPLLIPVLVVLVAAFFWWIGGKSTEASAPLPAPVTGQGVVDVDKVNLRAGPTLLSPVKLVLPRGTKVEALGQQHRSPLGILWVKVRVKTREGAQEGWVDNRYVMRT